MRLRTLAVVVLLGLFVGCAPKVSGVRVQLAGDVPAPGAGPHVEMHYLGNGGWLIKRGEDMVATAPFVSNPAGAAVYLPSPPDTERIDATIPVMPELKVVLIGHSHYDHAMDLPHILATRAPSATLYGSKTVKHLLGDTVGHQRVVDVTDSRNGRRPAQGETPGEWVYPADAPFVRFMPLSSMHAPHVLRFIKVVSWSTLKTDVPKSELPTMPAAWPEGETLAYVIDFLSREDKSVVQFRVYYQDAAAEPGKGILPTLTPPDQAPVDARQVVGGHWEDFFSRPSTDHEHRVAFGTSIDAFVKRARDVTPAPIYIPTPGRKLFIPIQPR